MIFLVKKVIFYLTNEVIKINSMNKVLGIITITSIYNKLTHLFRRTKNYIINVNPSVRSFEFTLYLYFVVTSITISTDSSPLP